MELPELTWEDKKVVNQFDDTNYSDENLSRQKQKQTSISDLVVIFTRTGTHSH
jgi:hypothetical protein